MSPKGIQRGLADIDKETEERKRDFESRSYVPTLSLEPGGIAKIRLLADPITYWGHKIWDAGKKRTYYRYCTTNDDDAELCPWCNNGLQMQRFFSFWVFIYFKLHPAPDADGKWKAVKYREKKYFQQDFNRPMLLRRGMGKAESTYEKFRACRLEYGSWTDRDYIWERNRATNWRETDHFLTPKDAAEIPQILARIAEQLPDLALVAIGEQKSIPRFDEEGNIAEETKNNTFSRTNFDSVNKDSLVVSSDVGLVPDELVSNEETDLEDLPF